MAINELQPDDAGATPAVPQHNKSRRAFSRLKRELTDEELGSPGAQKMLLEELERLGEDNSVLQSYRDKFYDCDKHLTVANAKLKRTIGMEILSGGCVAIGAAAMGYAPAVWTSQPTGWISLVFGAVVTVVGIAAKAMTYEN